MRSAFCARVCACARRPADSGTSAECLPFPQSFDVTRSRCDNEPRAPPQGEHPAVRPGLCQSSGSNAQTHTHNLQAQQRRSRIRHSELFDFDRALGWREDEENRWKPEHIRAIWPHNAADCADRYQKSSEMYSRYIEIWTMYAKF